MIWKGISKVNKTIELKCNLRAVIRRASTESAAMNAAVEMGLLSCLDELATRASAINDPVAKELLRLLGLEEALGERVEMPVND